MCAFSFETPQRIFLFFFKFINFRVCKKLRPLLRTLVCALVRVMPARFTKSSIGLACLTIIFGVGFFVVSFCFGGSLF